MTTPPSALARHVGADLRTCWDAIEVEATARTSDSARLQGVKTLGVDEHICGRPDNGSEFGASFHWHLLDRGIDHVRIKPRTPRLNGKVCEDLARRCTGLV